MGGGAKRENKGKYLKKFVKAEKSPPPRSLYHFSKSLALRIFILTRITLTD
jgi:hypothetical protein